MAGLQVDDRGVVRGVHALPGGPVLPPVLHAHSGRAGRRIWRGAAVVRQVYLSVGDCRGVQRHQAAQGESGLSDRQVLWAVFRVLPVGASAGKFDLVLG